MSDEDYLMSYEDHEMEDLEEDEEEEEEDIFTLEEEVTNSSRSNEELKFQSNSSSEIQPSISDFEHYYYSSDSKEKLTQMKCISKVYWSFLLFNGDQTIKVHTEISYGRDPVKKCKEKNKRDRKAKKKKKLQKTQFLRICWKIEMIIGPFNTKQEAESFSIDWKENSRGQDSRRRKGLELAKRTEKTVYDARKKSLVDKND